MLTLRPYQQTAVDEIRAQYRARVKSVLFVLSTGGGKTVIFSYIAAGAAAKGTRVCICVHRRELLNQTSQALTGMGVPHGRIEPGSAPSDELVQVASIQTLVRRKRLEFDMLIFDEGHHATAGTWETICAKYPKAKILGVTATPCRMTGKGLGMAYDEMVVGPSMKDLIVGGYLCQSQVWTSHQLDATQLKTRGGDYMREKLAEILDKRQIIGDCVEQYTKICPGVPAIAFCISVEHAEHVAQAFNDAGYTAASVDGSMKTEVRDGLIRGLGEGRLQVLTSCDLISEGVDIPVVTAAILMRPTKSLGLYLQQVGRVLRPAPGKPKAIILDHVGNVVLHGLPEQRREWSLEEGVITPTKEKDEDDFEIRTCDECFLTHPWLPVCPNCGYEYPKQERKVETIGGDLKPLPHKEFLAALDDAETQEQLKALQDRQKKPKKWMDRHIKNKVAERLEQMAF